ncbi:MAG TPA: BatA domain-containing protein, partial [Planctomycetota bacterium]|nr:BatA domain-containing protein [Planctomycetota bacterium]
MLAFAFLNPLLLWALPLCAVPIVIHLLNRRRFKVVKWGAMEYLLAALKRNRKRLRMEQWLVLLLRTLAVLLLVFLVSRPQLGGGGLIGGKTHHVVLLDDSASTTQRSGSTNLFDKEQDQVRALADKLGDTRGGDLFSLVRTSRPTQPDLWGQRVGPELGKRTGSMLKEMSVGDGTFDLGELLKLTRKRAADLKEASQTDYYLVTDLRASDWLTEDDKPRSVLVAELAAMKPGVEHLTTMAIGDREADNLAVVAMRRTDRLSMVGVPTALAVEVQNFGLDASAPTELAVEVDGSSRVVRPVPGLAPGQKVAIPITHTFHQAGSHRIEAQVPPSERYPLDDRRALALEVVERSRVLLVDGDPAEGQNDAGTLFLTVALDPGGDSISGIEPQVVQDSALADIDLQQFDMVWLGNVPCPSEAVVQKLEKFVAGGGGLVVFAGPQVDVARYNELLYKNGKGLLPLAFGEVAGDPDRPDHLFLSKREHPIAARFPEILELLLNRAVLVKRCLPMLEESGSTAAVIARLHDAEGAPIMASRAFGGGGGEVMALSITADKQWSNFPDTYANVVIVQEVHHFAAKVHDLAASN